MCKSANDPGGPRRCNGDARVGWRRSAAAVAALADYRQHLGEQLDATSSAGPGTSTSLLRQYRADAVQCPRAAATRFARAVLAPGASVLVDTESVDLAGAICEVAMIDTATGAVLVNTLVNPGVPISADARAVHGISDAEVQAPGVPTWDAVYPLLENAADGRIVLAYNANYDHGVIAADCRRYGLVDASLAAGNRWADVMVPRSDHAGSEKFLRNGGGHRALGDVEQTRQHLLGMAGRSGEFQPS